MVFLKVNSSAPRQCPQHRDHSFELCSTLFSSVLYSSKGFNTGIGINPGLFAAYKGHHYAGPGNHFCEFSHVHTH
ncbi:hypothetical protein HZH66_009900 [Vespula vulgaris]|uniref:Uncharacterized protein n=1 Tax=Vespula vulgaris TaxID=7454 RepID=A0A834JI22_VESVU|nr:hypothetical protein HZH66_009900 [Vespula vulgaris]